MTYSGDLAPENDFIRNSTLAMLELAGNDDKTWLGYDEEEFMAKLQALEQKAYKEVDRLGANTPEVFKRDAKDEAKYTYSKLYSDYLRNRREILRQPYQPSPKMLAFAERYDFNDPERLNHSVIYGRAAFAWYLALQERWNDPAYSGSEPPVAGFHRFLKAKKVKQDMVDYLLITYVAQRGFGIDVAHAPAGYHYLEKAVSSVENKLELSYAYQEYARQKSVEYQKRRK